MATRNLAYDHAQYILHQAESAGEAGGGATTQYAKFCAFTAMQAYSAQLTVTTAGTATANLFSIIKISGTATSTLATSTLGTGVAGTTVNVALSTAAGGAALLQGDILATLSGADVVGKAAVCYEISVAPLGNVTV
jgi:hypothetical protein